MSYATRRRDMSSTRVVNDREPSESSQDRALYSPTTSDLGASWRIRAISRGALLVHDSRNRFLYPQHRRAGGREPAADWQRRTR